MWHILDVNSTWMKEFAAALARIVPTRFWAPQIRNFGYFERWEAISHLQNPPLEYWQIPLQRCYARYRAGEWLGIPAQLTRRLLRSEAEPKTSVLICTSPFYAPVAEQWPGRVVYYLTDLVAAYPQLKRRQIEALDRRMSQAALLICPNSRQTAQYLENIAGAGAPGIEVIPNATRQSNILPAAAKKPMALPPDIRDLPRPVVSVIGNLSYNMDWLFLRETIRRTPEYSWVFTGPTDMAIANPAHRGAREELMSAGGRVRFTGRKPYGDLCNYARACDVAVLPYLRSDATFACSATRFYEHLAACRPMISTRAVEELLHKEPLLRLVDTPQQAESELRRLAEIGFSDGYEEARWRASVANTWDARAEAMVAAVTEMSGGKVRAVPQKVNVA